MMALDDKFMDDCRIIDMPEKIDTDKVCDKTAGRTKRIIAAYDWFRTAFKRYTPIEGSHIEVMDEMMERIDGLINLDKITNMDIQTSASVLAGRLIQDPNYEMYSPLPVSTFLNGLIQRAYERHEGDEYKLTLTDVTIDRMYNNLSGSAEKRFIINHKGDLGADSLHNSKFLHVTVDGDMHNDCGYRSEALILKVRGDAHENCLSRMKRSYIEIDGSLKENSFHWCTVSTIKVKGEISSCFGADSEHCYVIAYSGINSEYLFSSGDSNVVSTYDPHNFLLLKLIENNKGQFTPFKAKYVGNDGKETTRVRDAAKDILTGWIKGRKE